jgi:hypothetical protein
LAVIFQDRRRAGSLDLEAMETAIRSAMHQAGATALSQLLQCDPPSLDQRQRVCSCGHTAHYRELRSRRILTAVGEVELVRPYYLCSHCPQGQFPFDAELDIENQSLSPDVRRILAVVGSEAPFDHGRQQMKLLAGPGLFLGQRLLQKVPGHLWISPHCSAVFEVINTVSPKPKPIRLK